MKFPHFAHFGLSGLAGALLVTPAMAVVTIDFVTVGNAGNAADPATGDIFGAVSYDYRMARNETTISQYTGFLNAVAATDSYGLYNPSMSASYVGGITQAGSSGSFTYSAAPGSEDKPVTFVSWFDAARFANWIHNGQPVGLQVASTTEDGAYTLSGAVGGVGFLKNIGATVWIPSEDEWYKAAYYDPNKGGPGVGGYWAQATRSDTVSGNTVGAANSANFFNGDFGGDISPDFLTGSVLTDVGAYGVDSQSAYGTNDQAGNVWEWNDAVVDNERGLRGGTWDGGSEYLPATASFPILPTDEKDDVGFRLVLVPEPSSALLALLSVGAAVAVRRRPGR
jgi:formylglycine-generating enzyme required for sulfatase activity